MDEQLENPILAAVAAGETLIKASKSRYLRHVHRATVIRWILKGRIPALKLGRDWVSTENLIGKALEKNSAVKPDLNDGNRLHLEAIERLKARGVIGKQPKL